MVKYDVMTKGDESIYFHIKEGLFEDTFIKIRDLKIDYVEGKEGELICEYNSFVMRGPQVSEEDLKSDEFVKMVDELIEDVVKSALEAKVDEEEKILEEKSSIIITK